MTLQLVLKIVAIVLFLVASFGVTAGRVGFLGLGLAAWALSDVVP